MGVRLEMVLVAGEAYLAWEHEQGRHERPHVLCFLCWLNKIAPAPGASGGSRPAEPTGGSSPAEASGGSSPAEPTGGSSPAEASGGSSPAEPTDDSRPAEPPEQAGP